ncbi:acetolactate synthase large subunit [Mycobacterium paraintracellulare]|nr:acetolactate synthase large subunit [Mycobacterium paraintracellulare]
MADRERNVSKRTGSASRALVEALVAADVSHAFTVPGESFLGALGALRDEPRIRIMATRHESGASFMAGAYGKITHRPALCLATRTVGATNLAIGVHTAMQDSTPLVALIGQVPRKWRHREAFQESNLAEVFGPMVKWAVEVDDASRLGELAYRAVRLAMDGRPGPVALILPEDILEEQVELAFRPLVVPARCLPDPSDVEAAIALLRAAERPAILVGAGILAAGATDLSVELAEREEVPVFTSWRRPDAFPNDHRLYLGQTGLSSPPSVAERLRAADALLVLGCRLDENTTFGYSVPTTTTRWVHVDLAPHGLSGDWAAEITIRSGAAEFLENALKLGAADIPTDRLRANESDRDRWCSQSMPRRGSARAGFADQQAIAGHLRRMLPKDAVVVFDAGNFSGWGARYLRWNRPGTFLGPISGAMGYAVPAAVGAKLADPTRQVVALAGDGGFLMTASEIETAVRERVPFVNIVFDNRQYGTIRMHQEARLVGDLVATALGPVDFAGLTTALGGRGFSVDDADDFPDVFAAAMNCGVPATIAVRVDSEQLSVGGDSPTDVGDRVAPALGDPR